MEGLSFILGSILSLLAMATGLVLVIMRKRRRTVDSKPAYDFRLTSCHDSVEESGKTKALVTGGCGCLGRELVRQLASSGRYIVYSLDLWIPAKEVRHPGVFMYVQADVTDRNHMERALEGMDVVFHTAGLMPTSIRNTLQRMRRVNVEGTRNVVEACKSHGVKRLVYTSTVSVVVDKDKSISYEGIDEQFPLPKKPRTAYTETKGEAETMVRQANDPDGLRTCALRPATLIGEADLVMKNFMATRVVKLGEGKWIMPWIEVKLAAKLHLLAEQRMARKAFDLDTNVFNVVSCHTVYSDLVDFCASENSGRKPFTVPLWLFKMLGFVNEAMFKLTGHPPFGDRMVAVTVEHLVSLSFSPEHTERELGWVEERPWREIMRKVMADYKDMQR